MSERIELESARVVNVGKGLIQGGKLGDLWVLESVVAGKSAAQLREVSSAFANSSGVVGGVYETKVTVEGDRLRQLGGNRKFVERRDGEVFDALALMAKADQDAKRAESAEAKAKRDPRLPNATARFAAVVQAAPFAAREKVLSALMQQVRAEVRALDLKSR